MITIKTSKSGGDHQVLCVERDDSCFALRLPHERPCPDVMQQRYQGAMLGEASGLGPRQLFCDQESGISISEWISGSDLGPNLDFWAAPVGRLLRHLHAVQTQFTLPTFTLSRLCAGLTPFVQHMALRLDETAQKYVPSHGDAVPDNFIAAPEGLRLLDWDFAAYHDPCWDLAYVAHEFHFHHDAEAALLMAYAGDISRHRFHLFRCVIAHINAQWREAKNLPQAGFDRSEATRLAASSATQQALQALA